MQMRFGLSLFPKIRNTDKQCASECNVLECGTDCPEGSAGIIDVVPDEQTSARIRQILDDVYTYGDSPVVATFRTIENDVTRLGFTDETRRHYIILLAASIASGSCENLSPPLVGHLLNPILKNLHQNYGVSTMVVGYGFSTLQESLNCNAFYSGMPLTQRCQRDLRKDNCEIYGEACYYDAKSETRLENMLNDVMTFSSSCSFKLETLPNNFNDNYLVVLLHNQETGNDDILLRDATHISSWDYDNSKNILTLYGSACENMKKYQLQPKVEYRCPDLND